MHDLNAIFDPDHRRAAMPISVSTERLVDDAIGPDDLPGDWRVEFEERAAIMEYDGNLPRERAEAEALAETVRRMRATERQARQL